ncbi:MAG: efflux RND transporter permease subunit [Marinilabiliaceae bacterium]|nr:efflux RND transporter permease subunit [Marinilabiliaceae bacterium]
MKSLTRFAVNNPVSILMVVLAIILLGFISVSKLGIDLFPDLNNPRIYIELDAGERSPEEMETRFVEQLEALSIRQKGVVSVTSDISVGTAIVTVEYDFGQNIDESFLDLQKAVAVIEQDEDIEELSLSRFDPNSTPVLLAALVPEDGKTDLNELRKVAEKYIINDLIRLEGIADVKLSGELENEVIVETNPDILKINNLSSSDLVNAINAYNRNVSGGYIEEAGQKYIIKGTGQFASPNDLKNLVVGYRMLTSTTGDVTSNAESTPILMGEVATVKMGFSEPSNLVQFNGKPGIGVSIYKETRFNTVNAVENVFKEFEKIQKRLPGYKLVVVDNQSDVITGSINEVESSAFWGIILAVIVLYLFMRRIGVTLVVSIAIPISVIATFNLMYFNGLTLNIMTLGGLALGAGMLVDNAIIAVENIFRLMEQGKSVKDAAIEGVASVSGALIASTITTVVVFLPVVYLQGASGELFKDQAWTVAFSLVSSLFIAIFFIPVLAKVFFKEKSQSVEKTSIIQFQWYRNSLGKIIDKRRSILWGSLIVLILSGWLFTFIGSEFMPNYQSSDLKLNVTLPAGSSMNRTDGMLMKIEQLVRQITGDKLDWVYSHSGPDNTESTSSDLVQGDNTGYLKLHFKDKEFVDITLLIETFENTFNDIDGLTIDYHKGGSVLSDVLGTTDAPVEVQILGDDLDELIMLTRTLKDSFSVNPNLMISNVSFEEGAPEISVKIDRYRAGVFNIDVSTIMTQLQNYLQGTDGGNMEVDGELTGIVLKMPDVSLADLRAFKIKNGSSEYLLSELAQIEVDQSPSLLNRVDQQRLGKIQGYPTGDISFDQLVKELNQTIKKIDLPDGFKVRVAGEELKRAESFGNLTFALILAIILVYMVMAAQFESLLHPFTILLSIPFAGVGVVMAFLIMGQNMNIMALIGIVMLGGIAVNDSILLVDAINRNKRGGMLLKEAIVDAGHQRLRPILMTSATTVLALLPLTFGFGESASLRSPMALAIIGGLISSTLLTLVVIPCLYYVFETGMNRLYHKLGIKKS